VNRDWRHHSPPAGDRLREVATWLKWWRDNHVCYTAAQLTLGDLSGAIDDLEYLAQLLDADEGRRR
jgi:hypothetical protein